MMKTLAYLLLASPVFGASTYSQIACYTRSETTSIKLIPTSTNAKTIYFPAIRKTTIIPSTTVTPNAVTATTTLSSALVVTETAPRKTDTFTSTITQSSTTTFSSTTTITTTVVQQVTTTSGDGTSTVPTSSGFIPIKSISGNPPQKRRRNGGALVHTEKRAENLDHPIQIKNRGGSKSSCSIKNGQVVFTGPKRYPAAVTCKQLVEIVSTTTLTFTAKQTKTVTLPAATSSITTTSTIQSTTTTIPINADTTVTETTSTLFSTTTTVTTTITSTTSNTVIEVLAPTATLYSACAANNIVNTANGNYISSANSDGDYESSTATSPYECCTNCITNSRCGASFYYDGSCYLFVTTTCPASGSLGYLAATYFANVGVTSGFSVSNGNCGYANYGGTN